MTAEPIKGRLRHRTAGRARVVIDAPVPPAAALERLADAVAALPGVRQIEIRPVTGSLIIRHSGAFEPLAEAIEGAGLLAIRPQEPTQPVDPIAEAMQRMGTLDQAIGRATGGRADLWNLAFLGLVAGGAIQVMRGNVAGPALALFGQAATLAMVRPPRFRKR